MTTVRVGVVGSGSMAEYHARRFSGLPGVTVAACADRLAESARAFALKLGIPRHFGSAAALVSSGEVDCISTAVVDAGHAWAAVDALERGLPVFAEKPLARTVPEARELCEAARTAGVPALVNFSKRNAPALGLARRLVAEGRIGRVSGARFSYAQSWLLQDAWGRWDTTPRWRWRVSPVLCTHGVLGDLGSHIFDSVRFLLGDISTASCTVTTFTRDPSDPSLPGAPDSFAAALGLASGAAVSAAASWRAAGYLDAFSFELAGDSGALSADLEASRDTVKLYDPAARRWSELTAPQVPATYEQFVVAVRGGAPAGPSFDDGLQAQLVIEACARSAAEGGKVTL